MRVFRQRDYVRYDFAWYGFGKRVDYSLLTGPATLLWINSYRCAPISFDMLNEVGVFHETDDWLQQRKKWAQLRFSGSLAEPYANWCFRVGRLLLGGCSPKWLQRWKRRQSDRYWEEYCVAFIATCPLCGGAMEAGDESEDERCCDTCGGLNGTQSTAR